MSYKHKVGEVMIRDPTLLYGKLVFEIVVSPPGIAEFERLCGAESSNAIEHPFTDRMPSWKKLRG